MAAITLSATPDENSSPRRPRTYPRTKVSEVANARTEAPRYFLVARTMPIWHLDTPVARVESISKYDAAAGRQVNLLSLRQRICYHKVQSSSAVPHYSSRQLIDHLRWSG
jgi:hypothetical protein